MTTYHYSQWDGTQSVFDIDEDDLLSRISEDLLAHGDLRRAMAELFQRGLTGHEPGQRIEGLHDLMNRLREQRQRQLERYNLDSMMDDLQSRLDDVVRTEREGIDRRLDEAARPAGDRGRPRRASGSRAECAGGAGGEQQSRPRCPPRGHRWSDQGALRVRVL